MPEKNQPELFGKGQSPTSDGPITCLGMTFENDAARREHFTNLLCEKLKDPAFRAIEGFPIGEDEDILTLSDPPYYTACPNPWMDDFIAQWEAEKPKKPEGWTYHREPFAADVSEGKNHPFYSLHTYYTKVPHQAIMRYILHYTNPGDIIFDGFCGTGMTGVAGEKCGDKHEVVGLGYKLEGNGTVLRKENERSDIWVPFSKIGKRKVILNDLSPAATLIANTLNSTQNLLQMQDKAMEILTDLKNQYGWMYKTKHIDGQIGDIHYVVWSDVFICPSCSKEIIYLNAAYDDEKSKVLQKFRCPHCASILKKKGLEHAWVKKFDSVLRKYIDQIKQVPVIINYQVGKSRYRKKPDKNDLEIIQKVQDMEIPFWIPNARMIEGDETRRNDDIGVTHVHHFYSKRNLIILSHLWNKLPYDMKWLATSFLSRNLTKGNRFIINKYNPKGRINGPLTGTLYIPSEVVEQSIFKLFESKIPRNGWEITSSIISTCSSTSLNIIENNSIDYIFLDPPFGGNYMYSELNFIWESWINILTKRKFDAIENKTQKKTANEYKKIMQEAFSEMYRILKPGHWITIEFSNTQAYIWNCIQSALSNVGFVVGNVSSLDKIHGGIKAMANSTNVKQDLIISAYKPKINFEEQFIKKAKTEEGVWGFVRNHLGYLPTIKISDRFIQHIPERDPRILYDQVVSYYFRNGFMVPLSSQEFQAGLRQRFAERDGMIFLPDEVAEYDRAKLRLGNEIQYALFVSDESTAIDWLRRFLMDKPQTYQEIQPHFMQEAQRAWKKNEKPIELQTLLDQNFLRYDGTGPVPPQIHSYLSSNWKEYRNLEKDDPDLQSKAKDRWYVPDPNQAGDIEKLRERALLREFETYKEGKKKLKLFRLEALRAGFKKAYAENNYAEILEIADRLPHDVLEEDQKLLMWYDLAKTRMEG
ncbi:MAG: DNA methylase [Candidatus Lokiarchaeota archaeon]|nr:DNA methylase [Candidatus Lokiarchaeota archaeon]